MFPFWACQVLIFIDSDAALFPADHQSIGGRGCSLDYPTWGLIVFQVEYLNTI
jgi:hypothetical protein